MVAGRRPPSKASAFRVVVSGTVLLGLVLLLCCSLPKLSRASITRNYFAPTVHGCFVPGSNANALLRRCTRHVGKRSSGACSFKHMITCQRYQRVRWLENDCTTTVAATARVQHAPLMPGEQGQQQQTRHTEWERLTLERPMDSVRLAGGRGLRLHCLSDLHTDYKRNMEWIKTWPSWKGDETSLGHGHEDVLLVAGDVSSSLSRFEETLSCLMDRYDQVLFVVGNHDLWTPAPPEGGVERAEEDGGSVEKLLQIHRLCESLGVRVNPVTFVLGGGELAATEEVCFFPLLSWYHASWDQEPDLPPEDQFRNGDFLRRWGDYRKCRWPIDLCSREDFVTVSRDSPMPLADFFAMQNDRCIEAFLAAAGGSGGEAPHTSTPPRTRRTGKTTVISFSHFVPRQELCPEKRFLSEPMLTKAIGSAPLEKQIRRLRSDLHIFGHTHIPYDLDVEGVRYVQWPLGSIGEQSRQCQRMREQGPLLVYSHDGTTGGLLPEVPTFWGDYYRENDRDVRETFVPEWALKRIRGRRRSRPRSIEERK